MKKIPLSKIKGGISRSVNELMYKLAGGISVEGLFETVVVYDLNTHGLRSTGVDDRLLKNIVVFVTSHEGRKYRVIHDTGRWPSFQRGYSPSIKLFGFKQQSLEDFTIVENRIAEIVNGTLGKFIEDIHQYNPEIYDESYGSLRYIAIRYTPTQGHVAEAVDSYNEHFGDVRISKVTYVNVPPSVLLQSPLYQFHRNNIKIVKGNQ